MINNKNEKLIKRRRTVIARQNKDLNTHACVESVKKHILPVLTLRGLTVFPFMTLPFEVGREKSVKALEEAMINNQLILLVTQKDAKNEAPGIEDIYRVGTISKVKQILKLPGDTIRVLVEGMGRAEILKVVQKEPFFTAEVAERIITVSEQEKSGVMLEALKRKLLSSFEEYVRLVNRISADILLSILTIEDPGQISDMIVSSIFLKVEQKQEILEEFDPIIRMEKLLKILIKEIVILEIERNISLKVKKQIDKMQKEYYLREQMKVIQNELGEKESITGEMDEYREKLTAAGLTDEAEKKVQKELDRLAKMAPGSPEGSVIRTYIDWILDLPWKSSPEEILDLDRAQKILDEDHYGLEKVKERIVEYLAIRKLKNTLKGPILCLIGPPGVGKTSIAKSIARALNRKYVRMSLGGVKDEAEIRGHRRTYIGAMPGRIINAVKQAGTRNPLILLDEIDKLGNDFRGDPASAMLEVLDSEQNFAFRDHYLELPFDLSEVMFMTTANNYDTIPRPLLDRMEVINISGYTEEEKVNIATRHLLPKQLEAHGLKKSNLRIGEPVVRDVINYYTRESGVRGLEREIASICRKTVKSIISNGAKSLTISAKSLQDLLGPHKFRYDKAWDKDEVGIATGLAWTPVGGETLSIEVTLMTGSGKLELTGQLGDVMKESAKAAISFIRSRAETLGIDLKFHSKFDIHIHVPEGAIPKDGPSAGITLAVALISALTGIAVRRNVAMTGEITLRGRVLPIGGLKEKILAANRAGITDVIIPEENRKDVVDIPDNVKSKMKFHFVSSMEKVIDIALTEKIKIPIVVLEEPKAAKTDDSIKPMLIIPVDDSGIMGKVPVGVS